MGCLILVAAYEPAHSSKCKLPDCCLSCTCSAEGGAELASKARLQAARTLGQQGKSTC